ncbi:MAG: glycosyl transferase [Alicyclobacillus macrosporangiidus]|uniref:glycosyl transferase n=1 Tax=Alicyclobacillus macrosporangiidus TaxID=392015 RepID=UPI0026F2B079|nr:glycosyl transferase [Alicyclobacillus macrosporangiidus]MCL6598188.1 glycosyl transferase [Alicyclobacillus macrosporangiidus]
MRPFPVEFAHLRRMTDDTGLLEHALGRIPRRREGYSTDDNARALWTCVEWMRYGNRLKDRGEGTDPEIDRELRGLGELADVYLSYLVWVQGADGWFHNNVAYGGGFESEEPSADCQGRVLWATAAAALGLPRADQSWVAQGLCRTGFRALSSILYPRGWAHALAAAALLVRESDAVNHLSGEFRAWVRAELPEVVRTLTDRLAELYRCESRPAWHWFEPVMTYSNGVFPWALWHAWTVLQDTAVEQIARDSLAFLVEKMTAPEGWIRPIGNQGWCTTEGCSQWDQQPLEVMKLAMACGQAYTATGDPLYADTLVKCRDWYYGANDLGVPVADPQDGACFDGLCEHGVNANCGAESTLSFLITEALYHQLGLAAGGNPQERTAQFDGPDRQVRASGV